MRHLLALLSIAMPMAAVSAGCATELPDDQSTPTDSGIVPGITAGAELTSLSFLNLPQERPYNAEVVLGGEIMVGGRYRGNSWELSFAPGASSEAQPIISSQTAAPEFQEVTQVWSTEAFTATARAGSDPASDDLFSLTLTSHSVSSNAEDGPSAADMVQLKLDNTPPIARITRICKDPQGTDCFGFTATPGDYGASNNSGDIFQVSLKTTQQLYVFGIARDKNFASYNLAMVGGQSSDAYFLCSATLAGNTACVADSTQAPDAFGFGMARSLSYSETLAPDGMVDAYSDDAPLLVWNTSYLTPDAYALSLSVTSSAHLNGDDDPTAAASWVTMLLTP